MLFLGLQIFDLICKSLDLLNRKSEPRAQVVDSVIDTTQIDSNWLFFLDIQQFVAIFPQLVDLVAADLRFFINRMYVRLSRLLEMHQFAYGSPMVF